MDCKIHRRGSEEVRSFMESQGWDPDSDDDMFAMWVDFEVKVRQRLDNANNGSGKRKKRSFGPAVSPREVC